MIIRTYLASDKKQCLSIFDSNYPKFFDPSERNFFENWLNHFDDVKNTYKSPTYSNAEADFFDVIEIPGYGVIACGGFYIVKNELEARFAWGMVHNDYHHKGYGSVLYKHRQNLIKQQWPKHKITLGTSQHTYSFYAKMGMKVIQNFKDGYGVGIDRYDMEE